MALTATAQSALPREPAWDEVIVPALRKRLKDESNTLAKRISAASITSSEDQPGQYYVASPVPSSSQSRPSAIPRPSLQQSRTADSPSLGHAGHHPPGFQRARALSQPYSFDPANPADSPPSDYSRSISPANAPKGTRIPVSRRRTGSTSSQAHSTYSGTTGRANGRLNGEAFEGPPLSPVEEKMQSHTSRSTVRVPRHKVSDIFNEQAPFPSTSLSSSQSNFDFGRQTPDRMSTDSEEHPFEHWYRGDVARNGGVGELRVARRQEMLDIANYGHTLRKASGKHTPGATSTRSRSSSRGREIVQSRLHSRPRADSVGARESLYIDQEDAVVEAGMVLDERPLTDLEDEGYGDQEEEEEYYTNPIQPHPNGSISSPSLDRSDTPNSRHTQNTLRSRIPQPSSRPSASPRAVTPTSSKPTRNASEPGTSSPSSPTASPTASPKMSRSTSQQKTQSPASTNTQAQQTPTAKRRAKSPAATSSASAAKKAKGKSPPSSMPKRPTNKEENRRSIGQYPLPPEGDEDAIPTWTQPVPANGNWDDVVIPVVARKKGLDGQYQTADGSPKPKEPEPVVYEPAPGTFGYDPTKARKRRSANPEQIPMDEFGQRPNPQPQSPAPNDQHVASQTSSPAPHTPVPFDRSNRAPSPPPFAHYAQTDNEQPSGPQTMQPVATLQPSDREQQMVVEDDASGGCCKCVIM
ncbi:hypothetical protein PYCCODRAFT_1425258 [Trametes coccinea BRFM310]|uniref:Uncharacterized protein n=1 Tax=Trametes coccinea (strain BRFM310) TaxID=1353009 RepID=A0A1Y2IMP8_TRAC3|nr:hypothetical protein PYCCODRAFT_1425258 [Trametes coccinea BRFM310]